MDVKQIYELVNTVTEEVTGASALVNEDLSNLVEAGTSVANANAYEQYSKALVNHIGKMVFVDRPYKGVYAKIMKDAWEFGSVLQKVHMALPDAEENESWELEDGAVYEENQFYQPSISVKFFNKLVTFEIPMSITDKQIKQSFSNAYQMNAFVSMIYTTIENSMTMKFEELSRRAINNMIGLTIYNEYAGASLSSKSTVKVINLLYKYNQLNGTSLTATNCIYDADFIKYASYQMSLYKVRLATMSKLFNIGATDKFTPEDKLHYVLLTDFAKASETFVESDTYHNQLIKLEGYEEIPYWQGTGTDFDYSNVSSINITTSNGNTVSASGILGVMFDDNSVLMANPNKKVTSKYVAKAEFTNNWFKAEGSFINDTNESFIVFIAQ